MSSTDEQSTETRPAFAPESYTWLQPGHGAAKLASSAVAPLVAAARGYATATRDNLAETAERLRLGSMNSSAVRQLKKAIGDEDAMVMPWHRMDYVFEAARKGTKPPVSSLQLRPSSPVDDAKYINLAGAATVLDANPGTPASWFSDAPTILLTEGIIKGDSVLTALLREHGVSEETLNDDHGGDYAEARVALHAAMESVPEAARVLIVSFVGVANWRSNPEWTSLSLRGREAWIAYDADTAVNRQVWKQADDLFRFLEESRKTKAPKLIQVPAVSGDTKAGLDDFFAAPAEEGGGTWGDVSANMLVELPDPPSTADGGEDEGVWRVSPDGTSVEESVTVNDASGRKVGTRWEERVPIGGRIRSVELTRAPTDKEIETGVWGKGVGSEGDPGRSKVSGVEVEVVWRDPLHRDRVCTGSITGPAAMLAYPPKDWPRQGGQIPVNVLRHPKWPPRKGDEWLEAVKANRADETRENVRWSTMGWVPSPDGTPVFIVGTQIVTADGIDEGDDSIVGVTDHELSGAENFGVIPLDYDLEKEPEAWKAQARADLEEVLDAYIDSGAWTDANVAATVLALGLRPCLPLPSSTVAYMVGKPRSGKSWSAAASMAFWTKSVPGAWNNDQLPGAAKDTVASTENAVSRTPIWVADDLAPSTDRKQASTEEAAMGDLIRAVHNRSGKRRMKADMTARDVKKPRALLIVTAENEPSVHSVSERTVKLIFGAGSLAGDRNITGKVLRTYQSTGSAARLAAAFVQWHAWKAMQMPGGWEDFYRRIESMREDCRADASEIIAGKSEAGQADRHAKMASDLMVVYNVLDWFAEDLGVPRQQRLRFLWGGLPNQVAQQVAAAHDAQSMSSPGRSTIEAVATLLSSGQAHIASAERATDAPSTDNLRNLMLGWVPGSEQGQMRPTGRTIGWLVNAKDGTEVVLLDPKTAFNEAQRAYPELIPYGNKSAQAWASVWDEGLAIDPTRGGWKRRSNGRSVMSTVEVMVDGTRLRGVPIALDVLIGSKTSAEFDSHDTDDDDGAGDPQADDTPMAA